MTEKTARLKDKVRPTISHW